jgi:hypothetical protein
MATGTTAGIDAGVLLRTLLTLSDVGSWLLLDDDVLLGNVVQGQKDHFMLEVKLVKLFNQLIQCLSFHH